MSTDRDKIIDRIQKCLRLSKSSEANEAAAAMRQAQKLMEMHAISDRELMGVNINSVLVVTVEPWKAKGRWPLYMVHLVNTIQVAFGVQALSEYCIVNNKARFGVRYFGPESRVQIAAYTHEVMFRQLWNQWRDYSKGRPWLSNQRGSRQGFWIGWLSAVRAKVIAFGEVPQEEKAQQTTEQVANALVLVKQVSTEMVQTKEAIAKFCGKEPEPCGVIDMAVDGNTRHAGIEAGSKFSLHRPMKGAKQQQLS